MIGFINENNIIFSQRIIGSIDFNVVYSGCFQNLNASLI